MSENIMSMANGVVQENPYFEENMKTRVPEKCRFCRIGQQKYVKSDKNWFFVGPLDR